MVRVVGAPDNAPTITSNIQAQHQTATWNARQVEDGTSRAAVSQARIEAYAADLDDANGKKGGDRSRTTGTPPRQGPVSRGIAVAPMLGDEEGEVPIFQIGGMSRGAPPALSAEQLRAITAPDGQVTHMSTERRESAVRGAPVLPLSGGVAQEFGAPGYGVAPMMAPPPQAPFAHFSQMGPYPVPGGVVEEFGAPRYGVAPMMAPPSQAPFALFSQMGFPGVPGEVVQEFGAPEYPGFGPGVGEFQISSRDFTLGMESAKAALSIVMGLSEGKSVEEVVSLVNAFIDTLPERETFLGYYPEHNELAGRLFTVFESLKTDDPETLASVIKDNLLPHMKEFLASVFSDTDSSTPNPPYSEFIRILEILPSVLNNQEGAVEAMQEQISGKFLPWITAKVYSEIPGLAQNPQLQDFLFRLGQADPAEVARMMTNSFGGMPPGFGSRGGPFPPPKDGDDTWSVSSDGGIDPPTKWETFSHDTSGYWLAVATITSLVALGALVASIFMPGLAPILLATAAFSSIPAIATTVMAVFTTMSQMQLLDRAPPGAFQRFYI